MFKIGTLPSPQADVGELTDFVELECLKRGIVSKQEILAVLQRLDENDHSSGHQIDDPLENTIDDVFIEIENRRSTSVSWEILPRLMPKSDVVLGAP